jgi:hypothetical protein
MAPASARRSKPPVAQSLRGRPGVAANLARSSPPFDGARLLRASARVRPAAPDGAASALGTRHRLRPAVRTCEDAERPAAVGSRFGERVDDHGHRAACDEVRSNVQRRSGISTSCVRGNTPENVIRGWRAPPTLNLRTEHAQMSLTSAGRAFRTKTAPVLWAPDRSRTKSSAR